MEQKSLDSLSCLSIFDATSIPRIAYDIVAHGIHSIKTIVTKSKLKIDIRKV